MVTDARGVEEEQRIAKLTSLMDMSVATISAELFYHTKLEYRRSHQASGFSSATRLTSSALLELPTPSNTLI
jgi:citrate lyase synthetase